MLQVRKSIRKVLKAVVPCLFAASLAACTVPGPTQVSSSGVDVDPNQPVQVALLVPTGSGEPGKEEIGRSLINAAQLAQRDLQNAEIDLRIYPTSGTTNGGAAAANQAVSEGAKVIVGPLFSTATAGAEPVARAAGVTMFSMSNNPEVASSTTYILGNSFANTAESLVSYGLSQGLRNYGIVYPSNLEGETARNAAASAVSRSGANLVGSEPYDLSVESIRSSAAPAAAALNARGANAVILTDGPTGGLGYIAESLRINGLSSDNVRFLGMQRWDTSGEIMSLDSLQGDVFAAPDPAQLGVFNGRYLTAYGENPHTLAGLAYDGIAAIGALISEARTNGGNPFTSERIIDPSGFVGATGLFRFYPNGTNQRTLAIFQVQSGQATVIRSAPRSFDSLAY
ncbi:penicillin-binding protein activator [Amaricoccus macauensis]|uniref:penicillin-binding protein activator n=1 Tax=Amaricoccus macauensis TaxID=57001 RepID=UPI003C7CE796